MQILKDREILQQVLEGMNNNSSKPRTLISDGKARSGPVVTRKVFRRPQNQDNKTDPNSQGGR